MSLHRADTQADDNDIQNINLYCPILFSLHYLWSDAIYILKKNSAKEKPRNRKESNVKRQHFDTHSKENLGFYNFILTPFCTINHN